MKKRTKEEEERARREYVVGVTFITAHTKSDTVTIEEGDELDFRTSDYDIYLKTKTGSLKLTDRSQYNSLIFYGGNWAEITKRPDEINNSYTLY